MINGIAQSTVSLNRRANPRRIPTINSWRKTNGLVESIISEIHQVMRIVGSKSPIVVENSEINIEPVVATTIWNTLRLNEISALSDLEILQSGIAIEKCTIPKSNVAIYPGISVIKG